MTSISTAISVRKDRSLPIEQPGRKDTASMLQRHIWQDYLDVAEDLRHNHEIKEIYGKRKETIERVFADAKEKHGMRWTDNP